MYYKYHIFEGFDFNEVLDIQDEVLDNTNKNSIKLEETLFKKYLLSEIKDSQDNNIIVKYYDIDELSKTILYDVNIVGIQYITIKHRPYKGYIHTLTLEKPGGLTIKDINDDISALPYNIQTLYENVDTLYLYDISASFSKLTHPIDYSNFLKVVIYDSDFTSLAGFNTYTNNLVLKGCNNIRTISDYIPKVNKILYFEDCENLTLEGLNINNLQCDISLHNCPKVSHDMLAKLNKHNLLIQNIDRNNIDLSIIDTAKIWKYIDANIEDIFEDLLDTIFNDEGIDLYDADPYDFNGRTAKIEYYIDSFHGDFVMSGTCVMLGSRFNTSIPIDKNSIAYKESGGLCMLTDIKCEVIIYNKEVQEVGRINLIKGLSEQLVYTFLKKYIRLITDSIDDVTDEYEEPEHDYDDYEEYDR